MALSGREFVKRFDRGELPHEAGCNCAKCGTRIQETLTGNRHTALGQLCSDCYFQQKGEWVATHPIEPFDPEGSKIIPEG
jgi:hypothetical protein